MLHNFLSIYRSTLKWTARSFDRQNLSPLKLYILRSKEKMVHLVDLSYRFFCADVSHRVIKSSHSDSESIKTLVTAIDSDHGGSGIRLGNTSVSLKHNHLRPYLIIDTIPLVKNLLNVILKLEIFVKIHNYLIHYGS